MTAEATPFAGSDRTSPVGAPEIGDEPAVSRAPADLAGKLAAVTRRDIAEVASCPTRSHPWGVR
ncbi:DUF1876 domain-containing protein [Nonomuraea phyllanthi]|uniref:dsRBD fold-containing protein n=1 Tax=Nonomuraea phyllanthi TaxID=2219224 RepID=UPI001292CE5B|nr:dsRBD fold-containing protein [Nonomuraea phyllanthi]QFY10201.1 DUF1876 domain-containing protein [Nonomuraea phyllanthi]